MLSRNRLIKENNGDTQMEKEKRYETQKAFLIKWIYYGVWAAAAYFLIRLLGSVLLPFLVAFLLAWILKFPTDFLTKRIKVKRKIAAVFVLISFFVLIGFSCFLLGRSMFGMAKTAWSGFMEFCSGTLIPVMDSFTDMCKDLGDTSDGTAVIDARSLLADVSGNVVSGVSGAVSCLPAVCMNLLIIIIETIFLELEYPQIMKFIRKRTPEKWHSYLGESKRAIHGMFGKYAMSYVFIFFLTFVELFAGLWLLGIRQAFATALFIAILDILPVLGTGTILLPWGVFAFFCRDRMLGGGILLLYLFITIVRNIVEPRLVGKQMGLSPSVTLPAILIGYKFFGILGVFLLPIGAAVFQCINRAGILSKNREKSSNL